MSTSLESAVQAYLRARSLSRGTRKEYASTLRKWKQWGPSIPIEDLSRKDIREILDRVQEEAIAEQGTNPGRTTNKARENLRAVMSWAWEQDLESGQVIPWHLKDLRKTCATYYDEHIPESSVEILGHAVGGITYRHYVHRDPLAFRAIMTIPQPSAFLALVKGHDGECPCCRLPFQTAD